MADLRPRRFLRHRRAYILTVWSESTLAERSVWRGMLETADGSRRYFDSLSGLAHLLAEQAGWEDPPQEER